MMKYHKKKAEFIRSAKRVISRKIDEAAPPVNYSRRQSRIVLPLRRGFSGVTGSFTSVREQ